MLQIGEFSRICQVSVKTLHHYDKTDMRLQEHPLSSTLRLSLIPIPRRIGKQKCTFRFGRNSRIRPQHQPEVWNRKQW